MKVGDRVRVVSPGDDFDWFVGTITEITEHGLLAVHFEGDSLYFKDELEVIEDA